MITGSLLLAFIEREDIVDMGTGLMEYRNAMTMRMVIMDDGNVDEEPDSEYVLVRIPVKRVVYADGSIIVYWRNVFMSLSQYDRFLSTMRFLHELAMILRNGGRVTVLLSPCPQPMLAVSHCYDWMSVVHSS